MFIGKEWTDYHSIVIDFIKDWAKRAIESGEDMQQDRRNLAIAIIENKKIMVCPDDIFYLCTGEINELCIIVDGFDGNDGQLFEPDFWDLKKLYEVWKKRQEEKEI